MRRHWRRSQPRREQAFRFFLFIVTGLLLVGLLIAIRSQTIPNISEHPFLFVYSVLIFSFLIGRLITSFFYRKSLNVVLAHPDCEDYEPNITFVVPCKNEEAAIANTIDMCFAAEYPAQKIEVIVINDGSTDGTGDILADYAEKYPQLIVIDWKENKGKREGMAEGFRLATGEIVIQIDSDSYIEPATVRDLIMPFANPSVGAVCGHADVANADENFYTRMQSAYYYVSFRVMKAAESVFFTVFCCSGCSSAYRKSSVMPILDFWLNEKFLGKKVTYGDDRSLTTWILREGSKTIYSDRVQAYTIAPNNFKQLFKQQLRWKQSWIINSIFTIPFLVRREPFTAFTYFIPLVLFSFITPFVGFWNMYAAPIFLGSTPLFYILGIIMLSLILILYYRILNRESPFWPYLLLWQFLNTIFFSYVIVYALVRIQDRGWGTRQ